MPQRGAAEEDSSLHADVHRQANGELIEWRRHAPSEFGGDRLASIEARIAQGKFLFWGHSAVTSGRFWIIRSAGIGAFLVICFMKKILPALAV